ncbi:hypothetical protein CMK14_04185 [Candidatus Poribacteria bacterium]|nr:hypothetical protein [Candidatus Poribacteria bacterium]
MATGQIESFLPQPVKINIAANASLIFDICQFPLVHENFRYSVMLNCEFEVPYEYHRRPCPAPERAWPVNDKR